MPSSNVRDDLPSHARAGILRQLADTVIWGVGQVRRTAGGPRSARAATRSTLEPEIVDAIVIDEVTPKPKALLASPSRTTAEAHVRAREVRERLVRSPQRRRS